MPQNSSFRLTRSHRFFTKNGIYCFEAKSRWGHPRGHLGANRVPQGPKNGSKQKITMPQNSNFRRPGGHRLFPKNGSYGYGAKSRWGPPRVHLGANGVPLGKKKGQNRKKLQCPKNSNFRRPRGHRFFAKNGIYGFEANSRWGHPRGHLGANRVPLGPKNGSKRRKLPCPKILIFDDPAVIDYSQKMEVTVMAPNHDGDPLGAILGPMGSRWV